VFGRRLGTGKMLLIVVLVLLFTFMLNKIDVFWRLGICPVQNVEELY
jgi:hypothetical protein